MSISIMLGSKSIARLYNSKGDIVAESEGVWVSCEREPEVDLTLVQDGKFNESFIDEQKD